MKQIPISSGHVALVDDSDYDYLSQFKWHLNSSKHGRMYARRNISRGIGVLMHREILWALPGNSVDHIDHNGLNNQRENIRECSRSKNLMNGLKRKTWKNKKTSSKFKGVSFHSCGKWQVNIVDVITKKQKYIGLFKTEEEAASAYDKAAIAMYGEYALTNQGMKAATEPTAEEQ